MNTKILVSLLVIGLTAAAIGNGITGAFFSDTETSTGNTFTAGEIDLKIDSDCSYNGLKCMNVTGLQDPQTYWGGVVENGVCNCSWPLKDLTTEKFFEFGDIKPGDFGENTLSIHVLSNDAWMCARIDNVQNNETTCTEPEIEAEGFTCMGETGCDLLTTEETCEAEGSPVCTWTQNCKPDTENGELAQEMNFIAWTDDCDNVWGAEEAVLTQGDTMPFLEGVKYPIADNSTGTGTPIKGSINPEDKICVGIYWCAGNITVNATNHVLSCDGASMGNAAQSDSLVADITLEVVQARHNGAFVCNSE